MTQDTYPKEKRSWVMSRIKSKDTSPEIILRKKLWAEGFRYKKNLKTLPGNPDIVFTKNKFVVFVDGSFWHGKKLSPERLNKMSSYWQDKIRNNIARDEINTKLLGVMGYTVLRLTDVQIMKNVDEAVFKIKSIMNTKF